MVVATGSMGELGITPGHSQLLTSDTTWADKNS